MNKYSLFTVLVTLLLNLSATKVFAIEVANDDGVNITYNYANKDKTELEVGFTGYILGNKVYTGYSGNLVIPEFVIYEGKILCVTSIGEKAFYEHQQLTSVTLPKSITKIEKDAFMGCIKLTSVNIPNGVTSIGENAFSGCTNLTTVTIPINVTNIGDYAFSCEGLSDVYCYAENVPKIYWSTFPYMLRESMILHVPASAIEKYKSDSNWKNRFKDIVALGTTSDSEEFVLNGIVYKRLNSNMVEIIGASATAYNLTIPESVTYEGTTYRVTSIGDAAFYNSSKLESVVLSNSITSLGKLAFGLCPKLKSIHIPNSVKDISTGAFYNCSSMTSITIPNSVTEIGYGILAECNGLSSVTIPKNVTSIGDYSFYNCRSLSSVTIPNNVTSIGDYSFIGCSGLTSFVVEEGHPLYDSRDNCNAIIETASNTLIHGFKCTVIPNSVTSIGERAFFGCSGLTSLIIPNSVTNIGLESFEWCGDLTNVSISSNITSIGDRAFGGCNELSYIVMETNEPFVMHYKFTEYGIFKDSSPYKTVSLIVPAGTRSIYKSAGWNRFDNIIENGEGGTIGQEIAYDGIHYEIGENNTLSVIKKTKDKSVWNDISGNIVIPNQINYAGINYIITAIGDHALYKCKELTSIIIPNSVTSIGDYAFGCCEGLGSITIPDKVTSIGNQAFYDCVSIESITIPNTVTSIGSLAFYYCKNLKSVISEIEIPFSINRNVFNDVPSKARLVVPDGKMNMYQETEGWNRFTNIIEISSYLGDAYIDGEVNKVDVNAISNYIMGKNPWNFDKKAADVNKDGKVNAADIVQTNNIINNK